MDQCLLESLDMTKLLMQSFYCTHEMETAENIFAQNVTFIGPGHREYFVGKDEALAFLETEVLKVKSSRIVEEEYFPVGSWEENYMVMGRLKSISNNNRKTKISRRFSILYHRVGNKLLITHMHISSPSSRVSSYGELIALAFDLFEKSDDFAGTIHILLSVIGKQYHLERIIMLQAFSQTTEVWVSHHWEQNGAIPTTEAVEQLNFKEWKRLKKDLGKKGASELLTLKLSSIISQEWYLKGGYRSILNVPMYLEGEYTGSILYMRSDSDSLWEEEDKYLLQELTKLISINTGKTTALEIARQQIEFATNYDSKTGLPNFTKFQREADCFLNIEKDQEFALIYTDFINFKYLNQRLGYEIGDLILKQFSKFISSEINNGELLARIMGDQFVSLLRVKNHKETLDRVGKCNEAFCVRFNEKYEGINMMIRSGIYFIEKDCASCSVAVDRANSARKGISHISQSTYQIYDQNIARQILVENEMSNSMEFALRSGQFVVFYQPKVSLKDFSIVGAEALVRWQRPDGRLIPPDDFIPFFEQNGFVVKLDLYVFRVVMEKISSWIKSGYKVVPISVNASRLHAKSHKDIMEIKKLVAHYKIPPETIEFELTETAFLDTSFSVVDMMTELQNEGFKTSIDDFGAGYSVLHVLGDMPADIIKLDKGFLTSCEKSQKGLTFLKQMVHMIRNLGYSIICEGVETLQQAMLLQDAECDMAQGFYFSRPIPVEKFEELVFGEIEMVRTSPN